MKQSLQIRMGQSLTMTPQLQQAIKLLQLSSLDLEAEILDVIESNPLLEMLENNDSTNSKDESNSHSDKESVQTDTDTSPSQEITEKDSSDAIKSETLDDEMIGDTEWEDWGYTNQTSSHQTSSSQTSSQRMDDGNQTEYQGETSESLRDQLLWQINMTSMTELDRAIAMILIDSIDESGFMKADLQDVCDMLNQENKVIHLETAISIKTDHENENLDQESQHKSQQDSQPEPLQEPTVIIEEVEAVLHHIQSFEPAGIGARDLQECLLIQLRKLPEDTEHLHLATKVLQYHFQYLANRNYRQLIKESKLSETQLKNALQLIQSLDPRPGNQINQNNAQYVKPDVYVRKNSKGQWHATLNPEATPKLNINQTYASLIKRADNSKDNQFLKNNLQEAKWFIKSLQSRNDTLLKVTSSIIEKQVGFLEYGEEAMKPLVLHDIADEVEMHESTISRVTTQKYMHTPKGIFELKYFFSSHVSTDSGGECSSTAIRAVIKKLIAAENQAKPLSDSKIATLLKDQGIKVARRTVAKYRESMAIPPSNERKSLF
ncbi:MAG: RNA polymerase factor sigma-54 [Gammaproteobacteria bacterium]|nr:MAG: RNA polymerase factor sigma-54 [Gammaproteobacteria bacterium]